MNMDEWINYRKNKLELELDALAVMLEEPEFILRFFEEGSLKLSKAQEVIAKIHSHLPVDESFFDFYLKRPAKALPETGVPFTFKYHRNLKKSDKMGEMFGQHIEPAGEYLSYHDVGDTEGMEDYEYGTLHFKNPLVLPYESDAFPSNYSLKKHGWKSYLFETYKKKGAKLSAHLISLGYDGIITLGGLGPESISEIVNLNGTKS